ncbi:hypothetical protein [Rhodococcus sp. (in: high G+C Gram-positive bacteria)]|uniref:hypothetical protein n=1 Tax=Rhodococcus sp. TaxID=1831 RepID=UPI001A1A1663|nr:hypothetical protein [Rhodococcus sp. (in: high G+C Gram-positive bacteria)]MBJ7481635.1 hypothetical protein [Rhodococcus sp. (in: high G+C Gram-positive bacteria)]
MRFAVVAVALLAPLAVPALASAQSLPYQPPVVSLVSDDSSITATITNPNDQGICTLAISSAPRPLVNDPNDHTRSLEPFTEDTAAWPQAGQTVELTRAELVPGVYDLTGWCGQPAPGGGWVMGQLSNGVSYDVRVGPEPQPTGSLMFGS